MDRNGASGELLAAGATVKCRYWINLCFDAYSGIKVRFKRVLLHEQKMELYCKRCAVYWLESWPGSTQDTFFYCMWRTSTKIRILHVQYANINFVCWYHNLCQKSFNSGVTVHANEVNKGVLINITHTHTVIFVFITIHYIHFISLPSLLCIHIIFCVLLLCSIYLCVKL